MAGIRWKTEKRHIKDLVPAEYNPRQMTEKQSKDLRKSLEKFDLAEIPAIDTDGTIIAGHQRLAILKEMGREEEEIDVRIPSRKLTEKEQREYNLRSNKNTGEWDLDKLAEFDTEMLIDTGFDSKELDKIFSLDASEEDIVPALRPDPNTKLGDLWQLGDHRLLCGDATKREDVERLMDGKKADMVFTDPPYGMNLDTDYSSMVGIDGGVGNKFERVIGDDRPYDPVHIFESFGYCKEIFLWGADYYFERIQDRLEGSWFVWDKQSTERDGVVGVNDSYDKMFGSNFELCWSRQRHKRWIVRVLWKGMFGMSKEDTKKRVHPTQKPIELASWFLNRFSKNDEVIVDLFLGSGTTIIAAERLGRKCYGMEIDPQYVRVCIDRWENETGKKAVLLGKQ